MPTIGEQLKQARLGRKLTIKQAVQATRVRSYYLEAMEADDFSAIPSAAQARGFLRLYAEYLGLNPDDLTSRQHGESTPAATPPAGTLAAPPPALVATPPSARPARPIPAAEPDKLPAPATPIEPLPASEPEPEPGPPAPSQTILTEIGVSLRERRELLSLTLDEIERHTHVRKHYLEKIEQGSFADLPSPVQARGMLNAYANFLDLDSETLLLRFADALQARRLERQPQNSKAIERKMRLPNWLKWFVSPDLLFGGSMILLLLGLAIWGAARLLSGSNTPLEATATEGPSISEVLLASPVGGETPTEASLPTSVPELATAAPTLDPAQVIPTETATLALEFVPASAVQLTVIVVERTFLRVTVDGEVKQDGRVVPGAALTFEGRERIELLTGSGAALQILYNGQDLGMLGNFGEVVNRIYTINGIETPTPTITPSPSITPRRPPTATPTITPRVTSTLLP